MSEILKQVSEQCINQSGQTGVSGQAINRMPVRVTIAARIQDADYAQAQRALAAVCEAGLDLKLVPQALAEGCGYSIKQHHGVANFSRPADSFPQAPVFGADRTLAYQIRDGTLVKALPSFGQTAPSVSLELFGAPRSVSLPGALAGQTVDVVAIERQQLKLK